MDDEGTYSVVLNESGHCSDFHFFYIPKYPKTYQVKSATILLHLMILWVSDINSPAGQVVCST